MRGAQTPVGQSVLNGPMGAGEAEERWSEGVEGPRRDAPAGHHLRHEVDPRRPLGQERQVSPR